MQYKQYKYNTVVLMSRKVAYFLMKRLVSFVFDCIYLTFSAVFDGIRKSVITFK